MKLAFYPVAKYLVVAEFCCMKSQEKRVKVVAAALKLTENTAIAPSQYELHLLEQYVSGALTIDEVIALLAEHERLSSALASPAPESG